jgi:hypothetical protein
MSRPVTRSTSYAPALDGPLTDARLKEVKKYAAEAKKENEAREKKLEEHLKVFKELYEKEQDRFIAARDKYYADVEKYKHYLNDIERFGPPTNKRKVMKEPKMPVFKDPIVPGERGGRRTRRGRGTRSTRRR